MKIKINLPYPILESNTNITAVYPMKLWQTLIHKIYQKQKKH